MSGSLLETLLSLFLFACILLAYQALAFRGLAESQANAYFSLAEERVRDLAEHVQMLGGLAPDLWKQGNALVLPNAEGRLQRNGNQYQLQLTWGDFPNPCSVNEIDLSGCIKLDFIV